MDEWQIDKPLGCCCGTGRKIEAGEEYYAALVDTEQGLQRRDFRIEYWHDKSPSVFCYWKTKLPSGEQKKQLFVDEDMLMSFFERLAGETDQEKINFRFVLAMVLMRKRRLKYDSSRTQDGSQIWRLRVTGSQQFTDVLNPNLDEQQIKELTSQIGKILQVDL